MREINKETKKDKILILINDAIINCEAVVLEISRDNSEPVDLYMSGEDLIETRSKLLKDLDSQGYIEKSNVRIISVENANDFAQREYDKKINEVIDSFKELQQERRVL